MLRHATGFKLANDGIDTRSLQAYLGHRNIQNTTRYTALAPDRFKGFFRDPDCKESQTTDSPTWIVRSVAGRWRLTPRSPSSARVSMRKSALDMFLRRFITIGRLAVRWPDGRTKIYEGRPGPEAAVVLRGRGAVWRLLLNPKLSLGEAYMDGSLVPLGSSIHDVLAVVLANLWIKPKSPLVSWLRRAAARVWRPVDQFNAAGRARRNDVAGPQAPPGLFGYLRFFERLGFRAWCSIQKPSWRRFAKRTEFTKTRDR